MKEEIKEMIKEMQEYASGGMTGLYFPEYMVQDLLDYITNLQQDLEKAIDTIEKDRQFYKCRMDEYVDLKKENEILKECYCNRTDCGGRIKDSKKYDSLLQKYEKLQQENERLKETVENLTTMAVCGDKKQIKNTAQYKLDIYKSRFEKTIEYINFVINHYKEQLETPIEDTYFDSDVNRKGYILSIIAYLQTILDTLIGSDENE